jgi:prephenate dehydratase
MRKLKISYQGEPGAFSEQAGHLFFGTRSSLIARETFHDIFEDVAKKKSDYAVVPIENSLFGSVHQNYDLLQKFKVFIVGELKLRIQMNLLARRGVSLRNIRNVFSHPQALGQCDEFLRKMKKATIHPFYDTAGAAKMVAQRQLNDSAAIASVRAASHYKLSVIRKNIENDHQNYTRFLIISRARSHPRRNAKTSLIFALHNVPGSLFKSLAVFALRNINLLKIESRPMVGKPWEYIFYVDIGADSREKECINALKHLKELTSYFKDLGTYETGSVVRTS